MNRRDTLDPGSGVLGPDCNSAHQFLLAVSSGEWDSVERSFIVRIPQLQNILTGILIDIFSRAEASYN